MVISGAIYGFHYMIIGANTSTPELNRAQALLTTAKGATNLVYMAELINEASDMITNKHGNPAWIVQTSYTDYDSIRSDMGTVADYCLQLNDRLSSTGQGILSDSWTYYANAIEKVREIDIDTLQDRIGECWKIETVGSQTAWIRTVLFAAIVSISLYLIQHFGHDLDKCWFQGRK